jgi:putative FmdB family regulatory protein
MRHLYNWLPMPTYQYACPDCGAEFERVQKFADKPIKKCPACGKIKVHRVVGRIAVTFRGSGFYINDSKSSSSSTSATKAKDDKAATEKPDTAAPADSSGGAEPAKSEPAAAPAAEAAAESTSGEAKKKAKSKKD